MNWCAGSEDQEMRGMAMPGVPLVPAPMVMFGAMIGFMFGIMFGVMMSRRRQTMMAGGMHGGMMGGPMMGMHGGMMGGQMMGGKPWMKHGMMMGGAHHHHGEGSPACCQSHGEWPKKADMQVEEELPED